MQNHIFIKLINLKTPNQFAFKVLLIHPRPWTKLSLLSKFQKNNLQGKH